MAHAASHAHDAIDEGGGPPGHYEILEQAVRELLIEGGYLTAADITRQIADMESRTPALGAKVVARAWVDPEFKRFLLADAKAAVESLGIDLSNSPGLVALEDTPERHHVIVCTLCSCYPRKLLGIPPAWYKRRAYRSRIVIDPRGVLREFGTELPANVELSVADSTADIRYIVIPLRPEGSEGFSEAELAELVTRDSLVGVALARSPDEVGEG
jgi:nitrile hydratase alpha subunit